MEGKSIPSQLRGCSYFLSRRKALEILSPQQHHAYLQGRSPSTWHSFMPSLTCKHLKTFQRQETAPFTIKYVFYMLGQHLLSCSNTACAPAAQSDVHLGSFLKLPQPNISPYFGSKPKKQLIDCFAACIFSNTRIIL